VDIFSPPPPGTLATPATHPALKPLPTYDAVVRPTPELTPLLSRGLHTELSRIKKARVSQSRRANLRWITFYFGQVRARTIELRARSRIAIAVLEEIIDSSICLRDSSLVSERIVAGNLNSQSNNARVSVRIDSNGDRVNACKLKEDGEAFRLI